MAHFFMVSPEYLEVMRIPVLRGRRLSAADRAGAPPVLMVSETFAKTAFPGQDAVGRRIEWNDGTWEIVGVTGDVRHAALERSLRRRRLRPAPPGRARQYLAPAQDRAVPPPRSSPNCRSA